MKKIIRSLAIIIAVLLMVSLASCDNVDEKINEATAPLNAQISALETEISELNGDIADLNGQIDALESENATLSTNKTELEADKAALEADKTALEADKTRLETEKAELKKKIVQIEIEIKCESGEHFWDSESEIEYVWYYNYYYCIASFDCIECEERASITTDEITFEDGTYLAYFNDSIPSATARVPIFTSVSFNSDSEGYDEATNTFTVTESTPFVLTFTGKNLDLINEENNHLLTALMNNIWHGLDYVVNGYHGIITKTDTTLTVTIDSGFLSNNFNYQGFSIFDSEPQREYENARIMVNVVGEQYIGDPGDLPTDSEGYMLVSNANELKAAVSAGGKVRLVADIESEKGFFLYNDTTIDLAGYDLIVTGEGQSTLWNYATSELTDSVGGSNISKNITVNAGVFKCSGGIMFSGEKYNCIIVGTTLDLSDYSGEQILIYVDPNTVDVILPEGYAFYNSLGEEFTDFESVRGTSYLYVKPIETVSDV